MAEHCCKKSYKVTEGHGTLVCCPSRQLFRHGFLQEFCVAGFRQNRNTSGNLFRLGLVFKLCLQLAMTTVRVNFIAPQDTPFDLEGFWEGDDVSVTAFSTGLNRRDGNECVIGGCGYDIPEWLDNCHIVGRSDNRTVSQPSIDFSISLSDLSPLVD